MDASVPHHGCFDYSADFFQETFNMQLPLLNSPVSVASFPDMLEMRFQEDCSGFTFCPPAYNYNNPIPVQNWASGTKVEEIDEVKVGRYSVEERKDRILRYLKKRNRRNFNKTIKYACRKTLADKRVRVRGRFAKNNEAGSEDTHDTCYDSFQQMMKYEEDYWLDNLGQWPYLTT